MKNDKVKNPTRRFPFLIPNSSFLISLFICLLFFPRQLNAQETADWVFTLDDTLNTLYEVNRSDENEFWWDPFFRDGSFSIGGHYGTFSTALTEGQSGFFMLDNRDIYSVPLPYLENGELVFPESFVTTARDAFARSIGEDDSKYRIAAIIIDPGHGGKDSGAAAEHTINGKRTKITEKEIVLKAGLLLRDTLTQAYPDKRILMTRDSDIFYELKDRPAIANAVPIRKNEAIIYISVHANASRNSSARGYEVWYLSPEYRRTLLDESQYSDSPGLRKIMNSLMEEGITFESTRLGVSILNAFDKSVGKSLPSRGLKAENWAVVRHSRMPAVLVELGFVTNRQDALLMTSDADLRKLVEALYKGIMDFVDDFEKSGGFIASR